MKSFFTPKEVARLIGISYRQIQYWDKTKFISPSYRRRGKYRLYTFADLIQLKVAKTLREANYSIQRLRKTLKSLRALLPNVTKPLVDLTFLIESEKILIFDGEVLGSSQAENYYISISAKALRENIEEMYPDLWAVPADQAVNA